MLQPEHRKLLVIDQGAVAFVINVVLNGGIAWLLFRSASTIPIWGETSVGVDLVATAILLPILTCLIVSRIVGGEVRKGKLPPLPSDQIPISGWSHRSSFLRGVFLAGCAIVVFALPVVVALSIADAAAFGASAFIGYKAMWAGLMAGTLSPIVAWWALADASRRRSA